MAPPCLGVDRSSHRKAGRYCISDSLIAPGKLGASPLALRGDEWGRGGKGAGPAGAHNPAEWQMQKTRKKWDSAPHFQLKFVASQLTLFYLHLYIF